MVASGVPADETRIYRRRNFAWATYDWANSAVVTMVISAVFPVFFNSLATPALGNQAASAFSFIVSAALLLSMIIGPILGTIGDITGSRKRLMIIFTVLGALSTCLMFLLGGEDPNLWVFAAILFFVVQIFLSTSLGLYNALLSHIARPEDQDRLSSLGYGLGYIGGGVQLLISVIIITAWESLGLPDLGTATRIGLLFAGVWWLIFSLPIILIVPEPPPAPRMDAQKTILSETFGSLGKTLREIRSYSEVFKMLVAFLLYNSGIGAIIQLATTYGQQELGLDQTTLIGALLLTQFVAFPFALIYGRLPSSESGNRAFYLSHMIWTAVTLPLVGGVAATNNVGIGTVVIILVVDQVLGLLFSWFLGRTLFANLAATLNSKRAIGFGLVIYTVIAVWGFFLNTAAEFWMLAFLVGTVQGGTRRH